MTLPAARLGDPTVHGGTISAGLPTVLIGNKPAARIGDMHTCPMVTGAVPHVGGPLALGSSTVLTGGPPQSRQTDMLVCVGPPDTVTMGEPTVLVGMVGGMGGFGAMLGGFIAGLSTVPGVGFPKAIFDANGNVVTQHSPGIVIEGTPEFQAKVIHDLDTIATTPTGKRLLESTNGSGNTVTITETANGNSCGYTNGADRFYGANGKPGKGTDAIVNYNPDNPTIGTEAWETRPPEIGLAHELVHADQANHGTQSPGMVDNDAKPDPSDPTKIAQEKQREVEAVGIPPHDTREFTENKIRSEWDPKQTERKWY